MVSRLKLSNFIQNIKVYNTKWLVEILRQTNLQRAGLRRHNIGSPTIVTQLTLYIQLHNFSFFTSFVQPLVYAIILSNEIRPLYNNVGRIGGCTTEILSIVQHRHKGGVGFIREWFAATARGTRHRPNNTVWKIESKRCRPNTSPVRVARFSLSTGKWLVAPSSGVAGLLNDILKVHTLYFERAFRHSHNILTASQRRTIAVWLFHLCSPTRTPNCCVSLYRSGML